MNGPNLVNDPQADAYRARHSTNSGMKATIGDPDKHDGAVRAAITNAHNAAREVLNKVAKLPGDETRTEVAKHHVASQIFAKGEAVILQSQATIQATADALEAEAVAEMKSGFETDAARSAIHTEIRAWIRETAKAKDGLTTIRKALNGNFEVAAVICHSPSFLLGLADEPLGNMMEEALKRWKPDANAKLDKAVALKELAKKYTPFVKGLGSSSFNATVAGKWNGRVEA